MALLRKSDVTIIKKLLKSYFIEVEDKADIRTSFRIVSDRMTPQGMKFKFMFFQGIDRYGSLESAYSSDFLYDTFDFDNFRKAFAGTRYELVDLDADIIETEDGDFWAGSFVVANVFGQECSTGDLTDFDLRYTYPTEDSNLSDAETYMQRRMNPKRKNSGKGKSVLGALILGGIIGHTMKKK